MVNLSHSSLIGNVKHFPLASIARSPRLLAASDSHSGLGLVSSRDTRVTGSNQAARNRLSLMPLERSHHMCVCQVHSVSLLWGLPVKHQSICWLGAIWRVRWGRTAEQPLILQILNECQADRLSKYRDLFLRVVVFSLRATCSARLRSVVERQLLRTMICVVFFEAVQYTISKLLQALENQLGFF